MALYQALSNCSAQAITFPEIFGATFLSVHASLVQNYPLVIPPEYQLNRKNRIERNLNFCSITLTHTRSGQNAASISKIWLPTQPEWNGRMKMVGGGGWVAGLDWFTDLTMSVAVADGYATVTTNGGVDSREPENWALLSPGNLDLLALQNFAYIAPKDAALATKSVIQSFYGRSASFSYFDGCSQGGRQGLMFAQRYPDIFNGIQAAAPAIHMEFIIAAHFPQQVMNEMGSYPRSCEIDALTNLAIEFCDNHDGLLDGIISDPDACHFDPYTAVGRDVNCTFPSSLGVISEAAAVVADAAWNGARRTDGSFLWHTLGHQANLTKEDGLARTECSTNNTCIGKENSLIATAIRVFVKKNLSFDVSSMSRREYEEVFHAALIEFDSIMGTRSPDLYEFRRAGGKMLTYHGLVRG